MRIGLALLVCWLTLFLFSPATPAAENAATNDAVLFAAKARELTAGKDTRIDKIIALQAFVRDEIAQAKTQYG